MKHTLQWSLILGTTLLSTSLWSQSTTYVSDMKKEISSFNKADSLNQFTQLATSFEKIATANPKEWRPLYYQALSITQAGLNKTLSGDRRDAALEVASNLLDKANTLSPKNSEIIALQAFIQLGKLMVDPEARGAELVGSIQGLSAQALEHNPNNPRALTILAQIEYGMAQYFNSSTDEACKIARRASSLLQEESKKANDTLDPTWGTKDLSPILQACQ